MPNLDVLLIKIQHLVDQQAVLTKRLDDFAQTLASSYVATKTYEAHRESDDRRFKELEKDNENQGAFRRQVVSGFVVGFLLLLIPLVGVVASVGK